MDIILGFLRLMKKPEKLKIMIIQGDEDNLSLYSDYLSKRGYHVIARYTKGNNISTYPIAGYVLSINRSIAYVFELRDPR